MFVKAKRMSWERMAALCGPHRPGSSVNLHNILWTAHFETIPTMVSISLLMKYLLQSLTSLSEMFFQLPFSHVRLLCSVRWISDSQTLPFVFLTGNLLRHTQRSVGIVLGAGWTLFQRLKCSLPSFDVHDNLRLRWSVLVMFL